MTKLKIYLTENDFIGNNLTKELEEEWLNNLIIPGKASLLLPFLKSKIIYKHIKNIYSEEFFISADCKTYEELEALIKNFEDVVHKSINEISKEEFLKISNGE